VQALWTHGIVCIHRVFFGFHEGLRPGTFLAMGLSVGLYLAAMTIVAACAFAVLLAAALRRWPSPDASNTVSTPKSPVSPNPVP
jgi:hypothetical protein